MKLESAAGMTVELPDDEYGKLLVKHGDDTKYQVLNTAGRVYKHRKLLKLISAQKITDDQKQQIESMARAVAVQSAINNKICEMGYSNYLTRSIRGGFMPESWDRIVSQASERIDRNSIIVDDSDRIFAMTQLGFYVDDDTQHSLRIVRGHESWIITVPDGWGGDAMKNGAPLGFDIH